MLKLILPLVLASSFSWALDFKVIGPCKETPIAQTTLTSATEVNLGNLTVNTLKTLGLPFTGDHSGISSIAGSPVGDDALEILSDTTMRAYGWCVDIDGSQPGVMPDQVPVSAATKTITWFYAYSLYETGVWKDYCTPAWKLHSLPVCK